MKKDNYVACKICIARKGLSGAELFSGKCDYAFKSEEEFMKHLEEVHNYKIVNKPKKEDKKNE
jgi:uncharacterized C2H2 Zn-finger protein